MTSRTPTFRAIVVTAIVSAVVVPLAGACGDDAVRPSGSGPPDTAMAPDDGERIVTEQYLDGLEATVHLAAGVTRAPLVVMVPGGAWRTADPSGFAGLAVALAAAGVTAVPVEVRAGEDGVRYPVPVDDVLCASAAAVAVADAHDVAPGPLVVLGHSSGAHLAALAVLTPDEHHVQDCPYPPVTPDALVGLAGTYDVTDLPELATQLFGGAPQDDPAAWEAGNPVARAGARPDVPVLLVHGDADELVPASFTIEFAEALQAAGHATTVEIVAGAGHHDVYAADVASDAVAAWVAGLEP